MSDSNQLIALGTYDLILSFPMEVKCVWKRKVFGTGTILYILIRYTTIIRMLLEALSGFAILKGPIVSANTDLDTLLLIGRITIGVGADSAAN